MSLSEIEAVLADTAAYDALTPKQQALARSVWTARMNVLRNTLRLDRLFAAAGYRYAELDTHGAVVIREPAPARKAQVVPLKAGRKHPHKKKRA